MPRITVNSTGTPYGELKVTNVKIDHDDGERVTTIYEGGYIKFKDINAIASEVLHDEQDPPIIAKVKTLEENAIWYRTATGRDGWIIIDSKNKSFVKGVVNSIELATQADFDRAQASTARPGAATSDPQGLWPGFSDL